MTLGVATAGGG